MPPPQLISGAILGRLDSKRLARQLDRLLKWGHYLIWLPPPHRDEFA